jgi:inosose dehydratase
LKSVAPDVLARVRKEGMSFAQAVQAGAMVEPTLGEPDMPPLLDELNALGVPLMAIVEHDLYPTQPDVPQPIASRTRQYYSGCGLR